MKRPSRPPPADHSATIGDADIEAAIFRLLDARDAEATICPSEVARSLAGPEDPWRDWMPRIRELSGRLASDNRLRVTRSGLDVDATSRGGPIRLGRPRSRDAT